MNRLRRSWPLSWWLRQRSNFSSRSSICLLRNSLRLVLACSPLEAFVTMLRELNTSMDSLRWPVLLEVSMNFSLPALQMRSAFLSWVSGAYGPVPAAVHLELQVQQLAVDPHFLLLLPPESGPLVAVLLDVLFGV